MMTIIILLTFNYHYPGSRLLSGGDSSLGSGVIQSVYAKAKQNS